jgi:S-formylglutathione hydrolase FrmB
MTPQKLGSAWKSAWRDSAIRRGLLITFPLRRRIVFGALFLLVALTATSQTIVRIDSSYAPSLGRAMKAVVYLPPAYDSTRQYPVLYLLHGLTGRYTDWSVRTRLWTYAAACSLIIVMPDGENSWYVNALNDPRARFEDYLVHDLPAVIARSYRIDTIRAAIAGLSMGGYGALVLGMRHPDRYFFAAGLSSAITIPGEIPAGSKKSVSALVHESLVRAFGADSGAFHDDHDLFELYRRTPPGRLPYIYLAAGIQDGYAQFLPAHRELTDSLRGRGIAYEYHELPGRHSWIFWDREIQPLLKRVIEVLKDPRYVPVH